MEPTVECNEIGRDKAGFNADSPPLSRSGIPIIEEEKEYE